MQGAQLIKTSINISLRKSICNALKHMTNENPSKNFLSFSKVNSMCYKLDSLKFFCTNDCSSIYQSIYSF